MKENLMFYCKRHLTNNTSIFLRIKNDLLLLEIENFIDKNLDKRNSLIGLLYYCYEKQCGFITWQNKPGIRNFAGLQFLINKTKENKREERLVNAFKSYFKFVKHFDKTKGDCTIKTNY